MATIVTRAGKGSPLTHDEVDANFTNLNTGKLESGDTVASLTLTSVDINGGTIDGTVIGGSTPAAISGTTGTFSGNLAVDTNTLFVDATGNRVGIGTSSPSSALDVFGAIRSTSSGGYSAVATTSIGDTVFQNNGNNWLTVKDGAPADAMRIDSSGNVIINEGTVVLNGSAISAIQVTVADDAVAELTFTNRRSGMLSLVEGSDDDIFPDVGATFFGYTDFGGSPLISNIFSGNDTDRDTTNTLTGTTGVDGKLTIGAAGTSGTLYIENRRGATRVFNVTLM